MKPIEQVSEVKTSKLGAILLTLMVVFVFSISQTFINDISKIVSKPQQPSYCILDLALSSKSNLNKDYCQQVSKAYYYDETPRPKFNSTDIEYGLEQQYELTIQKANPLFLLQEELKSESNKLQTLRQNLQDQLPTQSPLQIEKQKQLISEINSKITTEYTLVQPLQDELKKQYTKVKTTINFQLFFYYLIDFLLQLIFVLPFFAIALKKYFLLKKLNSPYTVIATSVVVATSLLILQIVAGFLFNALPWGYLEKVWVWMNQIQFLKYIVYYLTVGITIAVFGGIVYQIQKSGNFFLKLLLDNLNPNELGLQN